MKGLRNPEGLTADLMTKVLRRQVADGMDSLQQCNEEATRRSCVGYDVPASVEKSVVLAAYFGIRVSDLIQDLPKMKAEFRKLNETKELCRHEFTPESCDFFELCVQAFAPVGNPLDGATIGER